MSKNTRWFEPERILKNYLFWTHVRSGVHSRRSVRGGSALRTNRGTARFLVFAVTALSWFVPFHSIEEHIGVTFFLFSMYEYYRAFPRQIEPEPEEVPEKARTLRLPDISFKEDNS